ncbi:hypothetical protein [Pseudoduganella sp.]|uniref:hypothetical protein n=1 Tax=Pseudoduganella sp. TaxID=1880898 RepID=UPI0035B0FF04
MLQRLGREQWFTGFVLLALAGHCLLYRAADGHAPPPEWPLLLDLLLAFPLAYAVICRPGWKQFFKKWASMLMLGMAVGSVAIPEASKHLWLYIDRLRIVLPALFAVAELALLAWIVVGLRRALRANRYIDRLLASSAQRYFGNGVTARLMELEARVWFYGLLMRRPPQFEGEQHFLTGKAGGNASNQAAWIALMAIDIPLAHLLLHYMWSPTAAWVATALTVWGLLYLVADYRATLVRPVSLAADALLVRCGALAADVAIPYAMIESVQRVPHPQRRLSGKRYFRHQGEMNVELTLRTGAALPTLLGEEKAATHAVLGVDDPAALVKALAARLT